MQITKPTVDNDVEIAAIGDVDNQFAEPLDLKFCLGLIKEAGHVEDTDPGDMIAIRPVNPSGATPTMERTRPLTRKVLPTRSGSSPLRFQCS